eukprot:gene7416-752_t
MSPADQDDSEKVNIADNDNAAKDYGFDNDGEGNSPTPAVDKAENTDFEDV